MLIEHDCTSLLLSLFVFWIVMSCYQMPVFYCPNASPVPTENRSFAVAPNPPDVELCVRYDVVAENVVNSQEPCSLSPARDALQNQVPTLLFGAKPHAMDCDALKNQVPALLFGAKPHAMDCDALKNQVP
eukprot:scpid97059/ scgid18613/ 